MRLPHLIHTDPHWQLAGVFALAECRCGARRIRWVSRRVYSPRPAGWPPLMDQHGMPVADSGWHKPPPGGWPPGTSKAHRPGLPPSQQLPYDGPYGN
jgi:hypothetical protein